MIETQIEINGIPCELYGIKIDLMKRDNLNEPMPGCGRMYFANDENQNLKELRENNFTENAQITAELTGTAISVYGIYTSEKYRNRHIKGRPTIFVPKWWGISHVDLVEIETHTIKITRHPK